MSRFPLLLLAVLVSTACAVKGPVLTHDVFVKAYGVPSGTAGDHYVLPGTRLPDARSGAERDALFETVAAVAAECPAFAESLFWVDCAEEPCMIFLNAPVTGFEADAWADVTCGDARLASFQAASQLRGGASLVSWLVGSPSSMDPDASIRRFNDAWPSDKLVPELMRQKGVFFR